MYTKLFYSGKHGLLITEPPGKSPSILTPLPGLAPQLFS